MRTKTLRTNYSKFVMGLLTNPSKMERLKSNPITVMKRAGLTRKEMSIILSGNKDRILTNIDPRTFKDIKIFHLIHLEMPPVTGTPFVPMAVRGKKRQRVRRKK